MRGPNIYPHSQAILFYPQIVSSALQRRGGMRGLLGIAPIPIQLTVDRAIMTAGQAAKFRIIGAPPNKEIRWSSFKNGQSTGELNAYYGDKTENNGTAEITFTPDEGMIGNWTKTVLVQDDAGNNYTALVNYQVQPAAAAVIQSPGANVQSGFDKIINGGFYLGSYFVSYPIAAGGLFLAYMLTKRR